MIRLFDDGTVVLLKLERDSFDERFDKRLVDHIAKIEGAIERLETGQTSLVLRVSAVESRVTDVEKTQRVMLAEVSGLAARR